VGIKSGSIIVIVVILGFASAALCSERIAHNPKTASAQSPTLLAQTTTDKNPVSAEATEPKSPCDVPKEYIRLINTGQYDAIGSLFADDAVYMGPDGKTRHGAKEIGHFYEAFQNIQKETTGPPQIRAASFFSKGNDCVLELEVKNRKTGEYKLTAVDRFTINAEGKTSRFIVYVRPGTQTEIRAALAKVH